MQEAYYHFASDRPRIMFPIVFGYFSFVRYKILEHLEPTSCQILSTVTIIVTTTLLSTIYTFVIADIVFATVAMVLSSALLIMKNVLVMRLLIIDTDMIAPFFRSKDRTYENWMKLWCQSVVYILQYIEFGALVVLLSVSLTFLSTLFVHLMFVRYLFVTIAFFKLLLIMLRWAMMAFTTTICTFILVEIYVFVMSYGINSLYLLWRDTKKMLKSEKFLI
ncbi:hypothetical protein Bhyg_08255 [Pseudolycoriella hygida]|uniref:Uncharacterized protein n=1 Tax=Pseudolycoriella hygida TaxID=35572 RepID=A0A9Q0N4B2_9DIPT|nr:hypothetical protein Bhyg_08255 [Pseudolycoriella hygida]